MRLNFALFMPGHYWLILFHLFDIAYHDIHCCIMMPDTARSQRSAATSTKMEIIFSASILDISIRPQTSELVYKLNNISLCISYTRKRVEKFGASTP
jgi:hypothetical protein